MTQQTQGELLLYCLGMGVDPVRAARLERLSTSEWDDRLQQSDRHGVSPLVYSRLKTISPGAAIPTRVMQRLREIYLHSVWRNTRLYHELANVLRMLQDDGIPVIALKGAHLAEVVYGNIALRPMGDVDILVRRTDLSRVTEKLLEIGYSPTSRFWIEAVCAVHHHLPPFTKPGTASIEIHWSIAPPTYPFEVDVDELWQRVRSATTNGVEVLVLSPEDLLLHLCLHTSYQHRFMVGLRAFCDIAETIRHYRDEMDWEQVQFRARQWGVGKCVYLTLRLARELLEAAVPDEVLDMLKPDGFDSQVVAWAKEQIFADESDSTSLSPNLAQFWGPKRLQEKAILLLKSAFPSPEVMARMYPAPPDSPRIYLYYPVRLKDLLLRHGRAAWRLLRHDEEMMGLAKRENNGIALSDWLASA